MTMQPGQRQFSIRYSIAAMIVLLLIQAYFIAPHPETLAYSDLIKLAKAGKVSDVTLSNQAIAGTLAANGLGAFLPKEKLEELRRAGNGTRRFITTRVDDPQLVRELEAANVRFTGVGNTSWHGTLASWVVPAVVFLGRCSLAANGYAANLEREILAHYRTNPLEATSRNSRRL
jgi:cell division protease FtsH